VVQRLDPPVGILAREPDGSQARGDRGRDRQPGVWDTHDQRLVAGQHAEPWSRGRLGLGHAFTSIELSYGLTSSWGRALAWKGHVGDTVVVRVGASARRLGFTRALHSRVLGRNGGRKRGREQWHKWGRERTDRPRRTRRERRTR